MTFIFPAIKFNSQDSYFKSLEHIQIKMTTVMKEFSGNYFNQFPVLRQLSLVITDVHMYIISKSFRLHNVIFILGINKSSSVMNCLTQKQCFYSPK